MFNEIYTDHLLAGVIQTTINAQIAWPRGGSTPKMSPVQDAHVWQEIRKAMRAFQDGGEEPRFIILPELSLPRTRLADFERLVCALNVIAIVGVDYRLACDEREAKNEGIVFIPSNFWMSRRSGKCTRVVFGKCHPAPGEKNCLEKLVPPWSFGCDDKVYIFDAEKFGKIGVSICYDFMDLERAVMYRGRIQHLFVLAYNRDLGMFRSLADALSRTVFCNVVVCNTGFYGGSVAVTPYHEAFRRTLYAHDGAGLFTTQVIRLPVAGLINKLTGAAHTESKDGDPKFKDPPPGVANRSPQSVAEVDLSA